MIVPLICLVAAALTLVATALQPIPDSSWSEIRTRLTKLR